MKKIYPETMPYPKGYYSPAIVHHHTVYVSGQLTLNEKGEPQTACIEDEVRQCMKNIETILAACGSNLHHILKVNVFIADITNWPKFNQVFAEIMDDDRP